VCSRLCVCMCGEFTCVLVYACACVCVCVCFDSHLSGQPAADMWCVVRCACTGTQIAVAVKKCVRRELVFKVMAPQARVAL
jgi:hypothetical protein